MTDVAEGAKDVLVIAGVGTFAATSGWSITVGNLPVSPNTAIAVEQTGGFPSNPKYLLDYPNIQVLVRGAPNGYVEAKAKILAVKDALLGLPTQVVNGDKWVMVKALGDIASLGYDTNNCPIFSMNFTLIVEPATGTNRISL